MLARVVVTNVSKEHQIMVADAMQHLGLAQNVESFNCEVEGDFVQCENPEHYLESVLELKHYLKNRCSGRVLVEVA